MQDEGDLEGLARLPIVSVFERASEPGGVWRSQRECINDIVVSNSIVDSVTDESSSDDGDENTSDESSSDESSSDGEAGKSIKSHSDAGEVADIVIESCDHQTAPLSDDSSSDEEKNCPIYPSYLKKEAEPVKPAHKVTNMYEALWTNGPKEGFEFFDYTFEEHFKQPLPVYMPRQFLLEYMLQRVTRNSPNIFSDNVKFDTQVNYTFYNETTKKFEATIEEVASGSKSTLYFDKCIWGGGINGTQNVPRSIRNLLRKENYLGKQMHSSTAGSYLNQVKGKRILLVGDAYSAEDLALQSLKLGAEMVYILSRRGEGICQDTRAWPGNKVELLNDLQITGVIQNGEGIRLSESEYNAKRENNSLVRNGKTVDLEDISTVIYCTGYDMNFSMLDPLLTFPFTEYEEEMFPIDDTMVNWEMSQNIYIELVGDDIEPPTYLDTEELAIMPHIHHGISMSNPNMMFSMESNSNMPLFEIDARAWLFLNHIIGDYKLPSVEEVARLQTVDVMEAMEIPFLRYSMDVNYQSEVADFVDDHDDHWIRNNNDPRQMRLEAESSCFRTRLLAHELQVGGYPFNIGTREKLNEKGERICMMATKSWYDRTTLDPDSEDSAWRTFRDADPSGYVSVHSGNVAVPLKKPWMDLDDNDPNLLNA